MIKIYSLLIILFAFQTVNAQAVINPIDRPDSDEPTKVQLLIYYFDIESINNIMQNYTADIIVRLDWRDERLINKEGAYPLNMIWHPNLQISNLRNFDTRLPEVATVAPDGNVQYKQRFYGTFASSLDFRDFPFDKQVLSLNLVALTYTEHEVQFILNRGGGAEKFSLTGWTLEHGDVSTDPLIVNFSRGENENATLSRSMLTYTMVASRHISYYWYKVVFPMAIIIFLSWAVFYIDPVQVGAQIGVAATSILTLIAFLLRLENILPPISYLTTMDYFVFAALLLVFFAYMEAVMSTTIALNGRKELALKLDFWSRFIYPVVFLIIIYFFWIA